MESFEFYKFFKIKKGKDVFFLISLEWVGKFAFFMICLSWANLPLSFIFLSSLDLLNYILSYFKGKVRNFLPWLIFGRLKFFLIYFVLFLVSASWRKPEHDDIKNGGNSKGAEGPRKKYGKVGIFSKLQRKRIP